MFYLLLPESCFQVISNISIRVKWFRDSRSSQTGVKEKRRKKQRNETAVSKNTVSGGAVLYWVDGGLSTSCLLLTLPKPWQMEKNRRARSENVLFHPRKKKPSETPNGILNLIQTVITLQLRSFHLASRVRVLIAQQERRKAVLWWPLSPCLSFLIPSPAMHYLSMSAGEASTTMNGKMLFLFFVLKYFLKFKDFGKS